MTGLNPPLSDMPPHQKGLSSAMEDFDIDIRGFLLTLWRRKFVILSSLLMGLLLVFIFISLVQPRYTAKALVLIETRFDPGPELRMLLSNMQVDTTIIMSEAEVLKSRTLAKKVIDRLGLMNDPEFNPALAGQKENPVGALLTDSVHKEDSNSFRQLSIYKSERGEMPIEATDTEMGLVIDEFLRSLNATPVPGAFVIQVKFTSRNAKKSALIANTLVDVYIEQRLEQKFKAMQKLSGWLDDRLEGLREDLRQSEAAVEEFRTENNLVSGARAEVTAQQLSELSTQLVLAKSKQAEAEAQLEQIRNWIKNPSKIETTQEALNSRVIQSLKVSEAEMLARIAELSSRYGHKHPAMQDAKAELKDIREKMRQEMRIIANALEADMRVAEARVGALQKSLDELEERRQIENKASIRLRELSRESDSSQLIFDSFLETYKRADEREKLQEAEARIISYATIPARPSYPNKPLFLSLATVIFFFAGVAIAIILEKLDNAFKTSSQLENEMGYACFGIVPVAVKMDKRQPLADYILTKPASNVAEAIRTIRMVINLRGKSLAPETGKKQGKVITVTSSLPGEGKTTFSTWLGRVTAKSGEKVLLIDCDLRRPKMQDAYERTPEHTLVDYLTGKSSLDETIFRDAASGAHVIFARSVPNNALDLISKKKMEELLEAVRSEYDLIILDTAASLAVSDARVLSAYSDQTLYAVAWNDTPREVVNVGVKQFADFGMDRLAFILTNVDIKKHSSYGYGDAMRYYNRYKEYYNN